jgi:hypothetical protein
MCVEMKMNNCPNPGPHQNWIYQPSNTYFLLGDHNANYYIFPYEVDHKTEIVIKGQYPYARHFSLNVAGQFNLAVESAAGRELLPDPGSTNPFLPGANWNAKNRNYTLKIRFTSPPHGSNKFVPAPGNNVIYADTLENGQPNRRGFIVLRIYVESIGYEDKTGGVGLPFITYCPAKKEKDHRIHSFDKKQDNHSFYKDSHHTRRQHNHRKGKNNDFADFDDFNFNNFPSNDMKNHNQRDDTHSCDITWRRFAPPTLQPEGNTVYTLTDRIERNSGQLLYIRWKAPTFPDTYHNIGITGNEDMQYWSMSFITPIGLLGLYTISDYQTIIDKKGYVNLVISFGAERPSSVTPENGFTWVDASPFL